MSSQVQNVNPAGAAAPIDATTNVVQFPAPSVDWGEMAQHINALCTLSWRAINAGLAPIDSVLVLSGLRGDKTDPRNLHFRYDQGMPMARAAFEFARDGRNVYSPLALFNPATIRANSKGEIPDVLCVLGFTVDADADKPGISVPQCPVPPNMTVESSAGNFQNFIFLDTALAPHQAREYGNALRRMTKAEFISDISHLWRLGGGLNWPGPSKLKRGRSAVPQLVRIVQPWDGVTLTSGAALRSVLAAHWQAEPAFDPNAPAPRAESEFDNDPVKVAALSG